MVLYKTQNNNIKNNLYLYIDITSLRIDIHINVYLFILKYSSSIIGMKKHFQCMIINL